MEAARCEYMAVLLAEALVGTRRAGALLQGQGWAPTKQAIEILLDQRIAEALETTVGPEGRTVDAPFYEGIRKIVRRADQLMAQRSAVVHAVWLHKDEDEAHHWLTVKRWGRSRVEAWTLLELQKLRVRLAAIGGELYRAAEKVTGRDAG